MKISRLLEQHFSVSHPSGLEQNFGDSYLCRHNKIYRNIRLAAQKSGFKFSADRNDAYQALPLSQLPVILSTKVIPFLDNVGVLNQLEIQRKDAIDWDDIRDNLRKNFIFHESCHAVAREISGKFRLDDPILNMLMEESFANTCELLAVIDTNELSDKIFYEWNSYTALFESRTNLKNAVAEIGDGLFGKIIFLGYLHSNFQFENFTESQLSRALKIATSQEFSAKQLKTIKALIKICFTLDERFKEVTTRFYMRLNGLGGHSKKTASSAYFENFEKNSAYREYFDKLILVVTAT